MKPNLLKRCERNLAKTVDAMLTEAAVGVRRLTPTELKALSDVLAREQPPLFYVQNVLVNAYSFLATFPAEPVERAAVERFLTSFREQAAADFAGKASTLKESLELQVIT